MTDEAEILAAVQKNDVTAVRTILDRNPSILRTRTPNGTLVLTAAFYGSADALKILLAAGADPNVRSEANYTTLHKAAAHGNPEIVRMLLDRGADPNATRDGGNTPLDDAREKGHQAVAELLETRKGNA